MANLGKIKEIAKRQGITLGALANKVDITEQGLHRILRDNSTKVETLEKIAKALNCSVLEFFDESNTINISGSAGGNITAAGHDITDANMKQALDEIAEQRKLTSEAQRQSADLINIVKSLTAK